MFNAHANSKERPEISNKQYLVIGPNRECLLSSHSPDPERLIVHPASGRSLCWSGESLTTAFETKKIMTLYTFNSCVLIKAFNIENSIIAPKQRLIKVNTKSYSVEGLEVAYEKGKILSISIKKFNKINELIDKQQFAEATEELKLTFKKFVKLNPFTLIKEGTYEGKQFLVSSPTGELMFSNHGLSSKRLIVHPASNRISSLTGEALEKAFIEQKVITRGQYYVKLLIDLNSLTKVDCKLFTPEELEERFAKEEIVSVSQAQFNQALGYHINNSDSARNFLKAACNRPNSLVNQSYLTNNRSSEEGTLAAHESNISTSTNSGDVYSAGIIPVSNTNEHIDVPRSNKKRRRSVESDGKKNNDLAKNYNGKQYLADLLPSGELIFLNSGLTKRLIVHPASNRASFLTGEALKKALIEHKVITRGQYYDKLLIDLNSLTLIDPKLFTSDVLEERFAKEEIVSVYRSQFNLALKSGISSDRARDILKDVSKRPNPMLTPILNKEALNVGANNIDEALNLLKKQTTPTNSLSGGKSETIAVANNSNIDHAEKLDSNFDALIEALYSEAVVSKTVVSQSVTCYSNDDDLENLELFNDDDDLEIVELLNDGDDLAILELSNEDIASLNIEQNLHINDRLFQQPLEANYRRSPSCFFKPSVDIDRDNPETRLKLGRSMY